MHLQTNSLDVIPEFIINLNNLIVFDCINMVNTIQSLRLKEISVNDLVLSQLYKNGLSDFNLIHVVKVVIL
jgi:hypothetical protein